MFSNLRNYAKSLFIKLFRETLNEDESLKQARFNRQVQLWNSIQVLERCGENDHLSNWSEIMFLNARVEVQEIKSTQLPWYKNFVFQRCSQLLRNKKFVSTGSRNHFLNERGSQLDILALIDAKQYQVQRTSGKTLILTGLMQISDSYQKFTCTTEGAWLSGN